MPYTSRARFVGLPLIQVDFGSPDPARRSVAVGWIAVGNIAIGPLLAVGGVRASRVFVKHSQWAILLALLPALLAYGRGRARSRQADGGAP